MAIESQTKRPGWGCSLAVIVLLLGLVAGLALLTPRTLAFLANQAPNTAPGLTDRTSPEQVATYRQATEAQLNSYGWVDQAANIAHIPIARAIALVAEQGLPVGAPIAAAQPAPADAAQVPSTASAPTQVDFKRDVLPIFEQRCSDCHGVEEPEEGLVLTGYKSVLQGSNNGPVIVPGDPDQSYLVELIVEGKMPKRGKKLTPEEIALITAWVKEGALEAAAAASASAAAPKPITTTTAAAVTQTVAVPTPAPALTTTTPVREPTQVDFQRDVLPIFEQRCSDCHGFEEPEEGLVLTGYKSVLQGSNNGPVIVAGDPDNSYLVELIVKGKMPKRGKKLTPEEIAIITAWVREGALAAAVGETTPLTPTATVTATAPITTVAAPTPAPTNTAQTIDPAQVDFQRDILPIFEQRCSDCHGFEDPEEELVLTSYRSVMQGSKEGPVIVPGDPAQSYLVELVVKGKMPKRGKKLTPEEIALITAWVQGGALEAAPASSAGSAVAPTATVTTTAALTATAPATATAASPAPATVSFKADVLPIFESRCSDCHGFEEPEEDLVLTGYRSVMQGSKNGAVIKPGDPDKSELVELIVKGKMPKRGKKLTPAEIAIITAWVKSGARDN